MSIDKRPGTKPKGGEQFSDPLSWTPDMKAPTPPSSRPAAAYDQDRRERDIADRIVAEYGQGPMEFVKPLLAALFVGLVVFSQVDRSNMTSALVTSGMGTLFAGGVYMFVWKDTLPPMLSLLVRGMFFLAILAGVGWYLATRTDVLSRPDKDSKQYRSAQDLNQ